MTDPIAKAAEILSDHRESIDRLDIILIYLLAERISHTKQIGKLKLKHDLPPSDLVREAAQMANYELLAKRIGLNPVFVKSVLRLIIDEAISNFPKKLI
ncbi:MAG: chorismate mutase [Aestuariivita sp.]|nr:chorismate mutase [Aestuariivita sp.]